MLGLERDRYDMGIIAHDHVDFENMDDDEYCYLQQLMVLAVLVDSVWIKYFVDKASVDWSLLEYFVEALVIDYVNNEIF